MFDNPKKEGFFLKKVKSLDGTYLEIDCYAEKSDGTDFISVPYLGKYQVPPHPDLMKIFENLKHHLASEHGYLQFAAMIKSDTFEATLEQLKESDRVLARELKKIKVTGVSVSGKERDKIVITGTYDGMAINTRPLSFENPNYGKELREKVSDLESEIFEFRFNDKKAQLDLAFEEQE